MKKAWIAVIVVIVVLLAGLGFAVRAGMNFLGKKAGEAIVSTATGGHVSVNGENVTVNSADGTASVSTSGSLPKGFPASVPTPGFGKITASYAGADSSSAGFNVVYTLTKSEAETAATRYQDQLTAAGFTIDSTGSSSTSTGAFSVFSGKKDNLTVGVTIAQNSDGTSSMDLVVTTQ